MLTGNGTDEDLIRRLEEIDELRDKLLDGLLGRRTKEDVVLAERDRCAEVVEDCWGYDMETLAAKIREGK